MEKHLERENAGKGRALDVQERPRALVVEDAHILKAIFFVCLLFDLCQTGLIGYCVYFEK